jgi:hypothetical protein
MNWMTILFRSRILLVFVLGALVLNRWLVLAPKFNTRSVFENFAEALVYLVGFFGCLLLAQGMLGTANATRRPPSSGKWTATCAALH